MFCSAVAIPIRMCAGIFSKMGSYTPLVLVFPLIILRFTKCTWHGQIISNLQLFPNII